MAKHSLIYGKSAGNLGNLSFLSNRKTHVVREKFKHTKCGSVGEQKNYELMRTATQLTRAAMLENGYDGLWDNFKCNEYHARIGQALRHLHNGDSLADSYPLYPDGYSPSEPYAFVSGVIDYFDEEVDLVMVFENEIIGQTVVLYFDLYNGAGAFMHTESHSLTVTTANMSFNLNTAAGWIPAAEINLRMDYQNAGGATVQTPPENISDRITVAPFPADLFFLDVISPYTNTSGFPLYFDVNADTYNKAHPFDAVLTCYDSGGTVKWQETQRINFSTANDRWETSAGHILTRNDTVILTGEFVDEMGVPHNFQPLDFTARVAWPSVPVPSPIPSVLEGIFYPGYGEYEMTLTGCTDIFNFMPIRFVLRCTNPADGTVLEFSHTPTAPQGNNYYWYEVTSPLPASNWTFEYFTEYLDDYGMIVATTPSNPRANLGWM